MLSKPSKTQLHSWLQKIFKTDLTFMTLKEQELDPVPSIPNDCTDISKPMTPDTECWSDSSWEIIYLLICFHNTLENFLPYHF